MLSITFDLSQVVSPYGMQNELGTAVDMIVRAYVGNGDDRSERMVLHSCRTHDESFRHRK